MIKSKEDLLGTKVRYEGKEQWELIKAVCLMYGIEQGTWSGCEHFEGNSVAMISKEGDTPLCEKVISVKAAFWEHTSETSTEFQNLQELKFTYFEKVFKPEKKATPKYKYTPVEVESIFDLKDMFTNGELYFKALGDRDDNTFGIVYDQITTENMLMSRFEEGRLLKREEIKWQDEVENYLLTCNDNVGMFDIGYGNGNELSLGDDDFLEAARIALRTIGEL